MNHFKVHTWGFPAATAWPPDLQPAPVDEGSWPETAPVVVYGPAAAGFQDAAVAERRDDGRLPAAILVTPAGTEPADAEWDFFDEAVAEGDWDGLRALLSCPHRLQAITWAVALPTAALNGLTGSIEDVPAEQLALPAEARAHLAACAVCRAAFDQVVSVQQQLQRRLVCPDTPTLARVIGGTATARVEAHVEECAACRAAAAVLRQARVSEQRWLDQPLEQPMAGSAGIPGLIAEIEAYLRTFAAAELQPSAGTLRWHATETAFDAPTDRPALWDQLAQGGILRFSGIDQSAVMRWEPDGQALVLEELRGQDSRRIETFRVRLMAGDQEVAGVDAVAGRARLPAQILLAARQQGADRLMIVERQLPDQIE